VVKVPGLSPVSFNFRFAFMQFSLNVELAKEYYITLSFNFVISKSINEYYFLQQSGNFDWQLPMLLEAGTRLTVQVKLIKEDFNG